jgi:type VI secretion system protein ImpH
MKPSTFSTPSVFDTDSDYKAEVVAAEMVENGVPVDQIFIVMLGAMKRTYRKDVETVDEEIANYDHKEYHLIKTHKEGIYDMLPEGVFHSPASYKSSKTEKEIIASIKTRRIEERDARRFFLPFEAAINELYIQMALYENVLDKRSHYNELVKLFSDQWEIFQYFDSRQANIFLHILPVLHNIRDEYTTITKVFELIFLLPVKISLRRQSAVQPSDPIISELSTCKLGIDFTTGNAKYDDGGDELLVNIGPMNNKVLQRFLPGNTAYKILELLCDYLLPVHLDVVKEFELSASDKGARLADGDITFNSTLGMSTYL